MRWQVRPLGPWLAPVTDPRRSSAAFRASWDDTLKLLASEVAALGCEGPVIVQADVSEADVRADGMLRSRARVGFPGVAVSFESRHGPLRYATDAYEQQQASSLPGWQANVRAIALSLAALRAVDRYGVSSSGEQYAGWSALPAARAQGSDWFTTDAEALKWMAGAAAENGIGFGLPADRLYRELAKRMHPDMGGDPELWDRLDAAARTLGLRKGEAGQ